MVTSAKEISDLAHGVDVHSSGNVGIGTASPTSRLHIKASNGGYTGGIQIENHNSSTKGAITLSSNNLYISSNSTNDHMSILANGNVGIDTTNPGAKLSVDGPAALANLGGGSTASSALYVNSTSGHVGELVQVLKNGATKMHMANDGKLGIGTASPDKTLTVRGTSGDVVQAKIIYAGSDGNRSGLILQNTHTGGREYGLYVGNNSTGGGLGNSFGISDNTAGTVYRLIIDSSGKVGIGESSPQRSVVIKGANSSTTSIQFQTPATGSAASDGFGVGYDSNGKGFIWNYESSDTYIGGTTSGTAVTIQGSSGNASIGNVTPYSNARLTLGGTDGGGYPSVLMFDNNNTTGAEFFMLATDNNWTAGANKFLMGHGAPSSSNADITIDSAGNVGIGTYNPGRKLDVQGTGNVYGRFMSTNATGAGINVKDSAEDWLIQADGGVGPGLAIYDLGRSAYRMLIKSNGNVGIGQTNPGQKLTVAGGVESQAGQGGVNFYATTAGSYSQQNGTGGSAWAYGSTGGTSSPATAASSTFGFHHWNGSAWSNPVNIQTGGRLQHRDTANSTHYGAASTVYNITNMSVIGGKLRFSIRVYFPNGTSGQAVRIYNTQTSLWFAGEVCIGSTYSNASATGLNRYSFSHNYNTTNNYGNILTQTESFGQVASHFTFDSHGYDTGESAHYFEFRHVNAYGNTMFLQFEGNGSSPDHANMTNWYYKHTTF